MGCLLTTKSLLEPKLNNHQSSLIAFSWGRLCRKFSRCVSFDMFLKNWYFNIRAVSPDGQWLKYHALFECSGNSPYTLQIYGDENPPGYPRRYQRILLRVWSLVRKSYHPGDQILLMASNTRFHISSVAKFLEVLSAVLTETMCSNSSFRINSSRSHFLDNTDLVDGLLYIRILVCRIWQKMRKILDRPVIQCPMQETPLVYQFILSLHG